MDFSRTHFEVLGLEGQVLGLEASSPRKLACPWLEDSTIFWIVKILWSGWKIFGKRFFVEIAWKIFVKTFFFFSESTCACVLGLWPWAFLSLAWRVSVFGKAVLDLGFFLCPWPRALCPWLHLWLIQPLNLLLSQMHRPLLVLSQGSCKLQLLWSVNGNYCSLVQQHTVVFVMVSVRDVEAVNFSLKRKHFNERGWKRKQKCWKGAGSGSNFFKTRHFQIFNLATTVGVKMLE